ncbi:EamA family transporter [Aquincola sp. S2]|uniref:EamA family transporter n=1 Tax=Pseudaquabacterium terrae TaxID=2732868 RepID=A0ABX2EAZ2_9BURK|nr:DMT family transporter [Aquabacterium terrae]NRF66038.1 EamA family transporter [Aquabacterium terrae]
MPLTALALVLVAALLHAAWNIVAKKINAGPHFPLLSSVFIVLLWSPLGLWLAIDALPRWGLAEWSLLLASAVANLVYIRALLAGYRAAELTVVYPVARGTGPLVSSFAAVLVLGETLGAQGIAGVLGITAGVFLIAGGPRLWSAAHDPAQRQRVRAGLAWGGFTGLAIATYTVIDAYAVKVLLISPMLVCWIGNLLRIHLLLPTAWADRAGLARETRASWRAVLLVAALSPLSYLLVLYAVQQAPLSLVAPAREVSMLFAALIGGRLLGESDRGLRLLGAACIAGGVIALATA